MHYILPFLGVFLSLSAPLSVNASSFPEKSGQVLTTTKSHLLSMMYQIQPKVEVDIPDSVTFTDVEEGVWYETAARFVVSQQIMAGTTEDTFSPDLTVTRGLVATVIANACRADLGIYPNAFADAASQWYRDAANWCANNYIMVGYETDYFGGEDPVTREDLAVILYQYQKFIGGNTSNTSDLALRRYQDHEMTSFYSRNALSWAVNQSAMLGTNNYIYPQQPATRGEVAFAIYRLIVG